MNKVDLYKRSLCFVPLLMSVSYLFFLISQLDWFSGDYSVDKLYYLGFIFSLLVLPMFSFFLWKHKSDLSYIDWTLFVVPFFLWFVLIPKGSSINFLFINPPLIGIVSLLYLIRFTKRCFNGILTIILLWVAIAIITYGINNIITIFPE